MKRRPGLVGLNFLTAMTRPVPLEDLDRLALAQLHDGLLPARADALDRAPTLRLGGHLDRCGRSDLDAEELLDGLANLCLVRVLVHLERVLAVGEAGVALLGHDRGDEDVGGIHDAFPSTSGSAASLTRTERAQTIGATSSSDGTVTSTRSRLRNDLINPISSSCATTTSGVVLAPLVDQRLRLLGRRRLEDGAVDERERPVADMVRQRARECGAADLSVHLHLEIAHPGCEDDTATRELGRADRALARTAGALLAPRLGAAAGDEPAASSPRACPRDARSARHARPRARCAASARRRTRPPRASTSLPADPPSTFAFDAAIRRCS